MRTGRVRRRAFAAVLATTVLGLTVAFGILAPSAAGDPPPDRYCAGANAHSSADAQKSQDAQKSDAQKSDNAKKDARHDDDWWLRHGRHRDGNGRWWWYRICRAIGADPGVPVLAPPSTPPTQSTQSAPVRLPSARSSAPKATAAHTSTTRSTAAAVRDAAPSTSLPQVPATQDAPRAATPAPPKPTTVPAAGTATQPVGQPLVRGDTLVAVLGGVLAGFVVAVAAIVFLGGRRRARG